MSHGGKHNEKIEVGKREKKNYARQWPLKQRPGGHLREYYGPGRGKLSTKKHPRVEHACVAKLNVGKRSCRGGGNGTRVHTRRNLY